MTTSMTAPERDARRTTAMVVTFRSAGRAGELGAATCQRADAPQRRHAAEAVEDDGGRAAVLAATRSSAPSLANRPASRMFSGMSRLASSRITAAGHCTTAVTTKDDRHRQREPTGAAEGSGHGSRRCRRSTRPPRARPSRGPDRRAAARRAAARRPAAAGCAWAIRWRPAAWNRAALQAAAAASRPPAEQRRRAAARLGRAPSSTSPATSARPAHWTTVNTVSSAWQPAASRSRRRPGAAAAASQLARLDGWRLGLVSRHRASGARRRSRRRRRSGR